MINENIQAFIVQPDEKNNIDSICQDILKLNKIDNHETIIQLIAKLSFFASESSISPVRNEQCNIAISHLFSLDYAILLNNLIDTLTKKLIEVSKTSSYKENNIGLNPRLGFSFEEDKIKEDWLRANNNPTRDIIPLFHIILKNIKRNDISSNLSWIVPGILNLLDLTILDIKLNGGVFLLDEFLKKFEIKIDSNFVSFKELNLFKLFEPVLINLCYFLPPTYKPNESLKVWKKVFPTLLRLYKVQFLEKKSTIEYIKYIQSFSSDILLQTIIPRISLDYENLTLFLLDTLKNIFNNILKENSVILLQRIIFVFGEYIIRNPFITTFNNILIETWNILKLLIEICPKDRIIKHKFDFLALMVLTFEKCNNEGCLNDTITKLLKDTLNILNFYGCELNRSTLESLLKNRQNLYSLIED